MSDATAEELNNRGLNLQEAGDVSSAEAAYKAAMSLAPEWSAPVYNLGLMYKYRGEWRASLEYNRRAAELNPEDKGCWWNLGIAATALGNWAEARHAWSECGITPPETDGPPDFGWGLTPVRLDPNGDGEVIWARRLDPARARIENVPLPASAYRWRDIVLTDGAVEGQRMHEGRVYSVFNALQLLSASPYQTFVVELGTEDEDAIKTLGDLAGEAEIGAEYWGKSTQIICKSCSLGLPDGHIPHGTNPAHRHFGLAARDEGDVRALIDRWLEASPAADDVRFYGVPRPA